VLTLVLAVLLLGPTGCPPPPPPPSAPTPTPTPTPEPEPVPMPEATPPPAPEPTPTEEQAALEWLKNNPGFQPDTVVLAETREFPVVIEGLVRGKTKIPAGASAKVQAWDTQTVTALFAASPQPLPHGATDFLPRAVAVYRREKDRVPPPAVAVAEEQRAEPEAAPPVAAAEEIDVRSVQLEVPTGVGPKLSDRAAWRQANLDRKQILAAAGAELDKPVPELGPEEFEAYEKTGSREPHGAPFKQRLYRTGLFSLAAGLTDDRKFIDAAQREAEAILGEPTWVIPAHDKGLPNYRGKKTDVDLGVAMRGYTLATMGWWLDEKLPPDFTKKLKKELHRRVVEPYLKRIGGDKSLCQWIGYDNNWVSVCLAGIIGTALYSSPNESEVEKIVRAARKHLPNAFKSYSADGYCTEGIMYHNYGFGHYVDLAEALYRVSGGEIDFFGEDIVSTVAPFPTKFEIINQRYPAFGDSPYNAGAVRGLQHVLAHRLGDPALLTPALRGKNKDGYGFGDGSLVYDIILPATLPAPAPLTSNEWRLRDEFTEGGLLVCRPADPDDFTLGAAFKAGHNGEAHNHNDEGTFVIATGSTMPITDIGSEIYTASTFNADRYKSPVNGSYGHNVPVIDGKWQKEGREAAAEVTDRKFSEKEDRWTVDLKDCYDAAALKKLEREFVYHRGPDPHVEIIDRVEFTSPKTFGTALMTLGEWREQGEGKLRFTDGEGVLDVEITASAPFAVKGEVLQANLRGPKTPPQRIGVNFTEPVSQAEMKMVIRPAR
jgi:hypothetical protein